MKRIETTIRCLATACSILFWSTGLLLAQQMSVATPTPATTVDRLPASPTPTPLLESEPATIREQAKRPEYQQLRYNEDWSFLRDKSKREDYLDRIKYIPLGRENWYVTIGGEIRPFYEYFKNEDFGEEPQDPNGFWLNRLMLHADWRFGRRFRVFSQIKSGIAGGRTGGARPPDKDLLDLHQLFVDFNIALRKNRSLVVRVGRQELSFGSSRFVSFREGPNVRSSFDALRATAQMGKWTLDAFLAKPVETDPGYFDDAPIRTTTFGGFYAVRPLPLFSKGGKLDIYYFGLDKKTARFNQGVGREIRHTLGTRIWSTGEKWDYNYEFAYQFGRFGQNGNISAWTAASDNGYTFENIAFKPRLGFKANITSGDKNQNDGNLQTFNALFPKGAYFGQLTPIGPANHIDLHPTLNLQISKRIEFYADYLWFWRTSLNDGVYGVPGNLLKPAGKSRARFVGQQFNTELTISIDRHTTFTLDYARFFVGDFLRDVPPSRNTTYFAAWITYKF